MRWYWIDRFVEFESGRQAKAIKCVSLAEDHLHDHYTYYPMMPHSLVIEGMAQTGGLLVGEYNHFREKVVLAKVPKISFYAEAIPGDVLTYHARVEYIKDVGAMAAVTSHKNGTLHAEGELVFAHLNEPRLSSLFDPGDFLRMMRLLGAYDIGRAADGSKLQPPAHLLKSLHEGNGESA